MLTEGFANYKIVTAARAGDVLGTVSVAGGDHLAVRCLAAEDFSYALSNEESLEIVMPEPGFVYAPVVEGQEAGCALVCLHDRVIGKIPMVYGETVEQTKDKEISWWKKLFGGDTP